MPPDKILVMANQIAEACSTARSGPAAVIAEHINKFWEPRMRARLFALAEADTAPLHPLLREALPSIRRSKTEATASSAG